MRALAKIAATGSVIAGVAGLIAIFGSDAGVSESRADILDFSGKTPDQRSFRQALDSLGHEDARTYVVNGNQVRVSTAQHDVAPRQAMRAYQRAFARRGLNDEAYTSLSPMEGMQRKKTALTGGLSPVVVSPQRVVMRGAVTKSNPSTYLDLLRTSFGSETSSGMADLFEGFRWVELHRRDEASATTAVAIWSGAEFDYDRMFPAALRKRAARAAPSLPPCPGCQLVQQFRDPERPEASTAYMYVSRRSVSALGRFYRRRCESGSSDRRRAIRRWRRRIDEKYDPPGDAMQRVVCETDGKRVTVKLFPTADERTAVRMETDEPRD